MERRVIASGEPTRRGQRTQHARTLFVREPRDLVAGRRNSALPVRVGKGSNPKPTMNGDEKSDRAIVAVKPANKTGKPGAERVERRAGAKGNANDPHGGRARDRETSRLGIERVRKAAQERKGEKFTTLLHHIDATLLGQAYHWLKRDAAPGVDGMTWDAYGEGLDARLCDLEARIHRGSYRAQPSLRAYIPKPDGRQRPLGIAALEDKIVQRAVVEVLNAIYETDFLGYSYGFRPGRGQHDALDALAVGIENRAVNWILDADIKGFFDNISHQWMMKFLEHRVGDKRVLRLIRKWLTAGVVEDGVRQPATKGTPQGAVISPLLANIYLHYVNDLWTEQWRRRHARGSMIVVRYADDSVVGFEHRSDAERYLADLRNRMADFDLELHPEKTRLIEFGKHALSDRTGRGDGKPETFNFLGFTHICARSRQGGFVLARHTRRDRTMAKLVEVKEDLRRRWHQDIAEQGRWLGAVVRGYFAYHAVPTNMRALSAFRYHVADLWRRALRRRSQKDQTTWKDVGKLADRWLPKPRISHPWPSRRFRVKHPRWEPYAGMPPVRFCAGGAQ
jgi:RNA-directed DNA polymerase